MPRYEREILKTENRDWEAAHRRLGSEDMIRLDHAAALLADEVGEINGALRKTVQYGQPLDQTNLAEEVGDIFFACAMICDVLGLTFEEVQKMNSAKLAQRYPNGFEEEKAAQRDYDAEREAMEMTREYLQCPHCLRPMTDVTTLSSPPGYREYICYVCGREHREIQE